MFLLTRLIILCRYCQW